MILDRPMREFIKVPDGCFRPWDLHPDTLDTAGTCVVKMLHSCFLERRRKRVRNAKTRRDEMSSTYEYAMTLQEVEESLDELSLIHI